MTAKQAILDRLEQSQRPLACHEFNLIGISQNGIASRLPELARDGKVIGVYRLGENFKEWRILKSPSIISA